MSAVPAATAVPPGQHAPFATVTENDHTAWIIISTAMGMAFTLLALLTRGLIRKYINRGWALDDTVLSISTALSIIQSSLILAACSSGLGKSIKLIPDTLHSRVQQLYYASNFFYLWALDLSKISVILFLRRILSPGSRELRYSTMLLTLIPLSTTAFMLATALQCNLSDPWIMVNRQCSAWFVRWQVQAAFTVLFEIAIFAQPVWLLWGLQTTINSKLEIVVTFALRLLTLVFTGMRLGTFDSAALTKDPFLKEAAYICWTQAEMSYSIIAATIPTARKLLLNLITYYNAGGYGTSVDNGRTIHESFPMKSLTKGTPKQRSGNSGKVKDGQHDGDNDSQEMIIRREITYEVHRECDSRGYA